MIVTRKCEHSQSTQSHSSIMTRCTWSTILIDREHGNDEAKRLIVSPTRWGPARKTVLRQQCMVHCMRKGERYAEKAIWQNGIAVYAGWPGRWVAGNGN